MPVVGLAKCYGEIEAVRAIDFEVAREETFGFLGPNGAGKSTTINMLCTLVKPTGGSALVAGHDVVTERDAVRRNIGLVFQDTTLDGYLTAEQNLRLHAELYGVPRETVAPRMQQVIEMVGLWERRGSLVSTFSGGMKRRLEIARGLLHSPRVLFLDEPTVGLDPQTRSSIWSYIAELKQREDITIFLTTHYMDEAEYCDRIAIMDHGKIIVLDTPEALKASVGKDRVQISTPTTTRPRSRPCDERFGIEATMAEGAVTFGVAGGEEFVPRLFAELGLPIRSVSVARPSLDDVFMSYTGTTIRDAEATASDRKRNVARMMDADGSAHADREPTTESAATRHADRPHAAPAHQLAGVRVPARSSRGELRAIKSRLAARADPLQPRPAADRHLAVQPFLFLFVLGTGLSSLVSAEHPRGQLQDLHLPRRALHGGDVHRHLLGRLDRLGPRVRLPARDDGRAGAAQLDRARQVLRRRDRRRLPGRDRDRHRRPRRSPLPLILIARAVRAAAAARVRDHRLRHDGRRAHHPDAVLHGADADADPADVLPLGRAVPRLRTAALARDPQPPRPAHLRRRPDAPRVFAHLDISQPPARRSTPASPGGAGTCPRSSRPAWSPCSDSSCWDRDMGVQPRRVALTAA